MPMWLTFMIVGVIVAGVVWFFQRIRGSGLRAAVAIIVAVVAAIATFALLRGASPQTLGSDSWWERSPWREIALFAAMLAGMCIRYVTKTIEERRAVVAQWKKAGSVGARPGLEFDKWEFAYPLLISAITFGGLLSQVKNDAISPQYILVSFQTGFFWQTLLAAKAQTE